MTLQPLPGKSGFYDSGFPGVNRCIQAVYKLFTCCYLCRKRITGGQFQCNTIGPIRFRPSRRALMRFQNGLTQSNIPNLTMGGLDPPTQFAIPA